MYDSIFFRLDLNKFPEALEKAQKLVDYELKSYKNSKTNQYENKLFGFRVKLTHKILWFSGSIHKFYKGNNLDSMSFDDLMDALKTLEDNFDIPLKCFEVHRLDLAANIQVSETPINYIKQFFKYDKYKWVGYINGGGRYQNKSSKKVVCFYDKIEEIKDKKLTSSLSHNIQEYGNVLRFELRWGKRLSKVFGTLSLESLLSEKIYESAVNLWAVEYFKINKLQISKDKPVLSSTSDLEKIALAEKITRESTGEISNYIDGLRKLHNMPLDKNNSKSILKKVKASLELYYAYNDSFEKFLIDELDKKIIEAKDSALASLKTKDNKRHDIQLSINEFCQLLKKLAV